MADWCGRGGGLHGSWERFPLTMLWLPNWPWIGLDSASIGATIAPWSGHDRASIVILVLKRLSSESVGRIILDSALKEPRSRLDRIAIVARSHRDRGSIASWSRFDRATIMDFFHESSPSFDGNLTLHASLWREENRASPWPSDHDRAVFTLMKIDVTRVATWRQVSFSIASLKSSNWARARDGDRVDSVSTASTRFTWWSLDPTSAEPPRVLHR